MKKKILIAEDEKPMAKTLKAKLEAAGFEAVIAEDGEEASELIKSQKFDLYLFDLMMPKKDGFTLLQELKKANNKVPIIVSSNLCLPGDVDEVKCRGAKEYFIKSNVRINQIIESIKKYL